MITNQAIPEFVWRAGESNHMTIPSLQLHHLSRTTIKVEILLSMLLFFGTEMPATHPIQHGMMEVMLPWYNSQLQIWILPTARCDCPWLLHVSPQRRDTHSLSQQGAINQALQATSQRRCVWLAWMGWLRDSGRHKEKPYHLGPSPTLLRPPAECVLPGFCSFIQEIQDFRRGNCSRGDLEMPALVPRRDRDLPWRSRSA